MSLFLINCRPIVTLSSATEEPDLIYMYAQNTHVHNHKRVTFCIWYQSNATSHTRVPNSRVGNSYMQVNCNDSRVTLCVLACSNLYVCLARSYLIILLERQTRKVCTHVSALHMLVTTHMNEIFLNYNYIHTYVYDILGCLTHLSTLCVFI